MSSTTGYARRQARHKSELPSALSSRRPLHLGQAMISSSFGSSDMLAFIQRPQRTPPDFAHPRQAGGRLKLLPGSADKWICAGVLHAGLLDPLGKNKEALESYRSYLRVAPDAPNRTEVQRRISELERQAHAAH